MITNDCFNDEAIARALAAQEEFPSIGAAKSQHATGKKKSLNTKSTVNSNGKVVSSSAARWDAGLAQKPNVSKPKAFDQIVAEENNEKLARELFEKEAMQRGAQSKSEMDYLLRQTQQVSIHTSVNEPNSNQAYWQQGHAGLSPHSHAAVTTGGNSINDIQYFSSFTNMPSLMPSTSMTNPYFPLSEQQQQSENFLLPTITGGTTTTTPRSGFSTPPEPSLSAPEYSRQLFNRYQIATSPVPAIQADGPVIVMPPPVSPQPSSATSSTGTSTSFSVHSGTSANPKTCSSLETVRRLNYTIDSSIMPPPEYLATSGCLRAFRLSPTTSNSNKKSGSKEALPTYQALYDDHRVRARGLRNEALQLQRSKLGKHPAASVQQRVRADRLRDRANEEDMKAGWAIVYDNNRKRPPHEVDLHGLHKCELPHVMPHIIRQKHEQLGPRAKIAIITGQGNNSRMRSPQLKPEVIEFLKVNGIKFEETLNGGILYVTMPVRLPPLDAVFNCGSYDDE